MQSKMALGMARRMASKKSEGGKCYACGGVAPSKMAEGGVVDDLKEDGVDEYDPTSVMDADGDSDDLEYSPEEFGDTGFGEADNEEDDGDNEAKRANFLKAYLIHRKVRKG